MAERTEAVTLRSGAAEATVALRGAEPLRWRIGGKDLLWRGDPEHWAYSAPILFPVVGAARDATVSVGGRAYPMPQHGIARVSRFVEVGRSDASVRLRLVDTEETRRSYPFAFRLEVETALSAAGLEQRFTVTNTGPGPMPYGLGVHPAFVWPLDGSGREGHRVVFDRAERPAVPEVVPGGLLARETRRVPLDGQVLPLDPAMFSEALLFLDARSKAFSFEAPSGEAIRMIVRDMPHLAVWSKPTAPFLSLEAWTAHADWVDASGDLFERNSAIVLAPGETRTHGVTMEHRSATAGA